MDQKLTLSELNELIGGALKDAFPSAVWVVAEVSELKENRSGHCYLELIEKSGNDIVARSRATVWSYTYRILKPYFETTTGQAFSQGIKIMVQVSVEYHASFGLSLNIKDIDPTYTVGDMAMQRREIIERLKNEGVFEMNKELELPLVPQKIAVISSATAAGYQDFTDQLQNNEFGFQFYIKLFQASMQGVETVPSIIAALDRIFQYEDFFDAVVIIRGGGATADLSSFDSYELAINITQFPIPVITGIGHEKDDTIIDLVAHTRLKTPTAVAEFLIAGMERFYDHLTELENGVVQLIRDRLEENREELDKLVERLDDCVSDYIRDQQQNLNRKGNRLQQDTASFSYRKQHELSRWNHRLDTSVSVWMVEAKNQISRTQRLMKRLTVEAVLKQESRMQHLTDLSISKSRRWLQHEHDQIRMNENSVRLLDPENVVKRGFTLTLKDGKIVKSVKQLEPGDDLETRFADGTTQSRIINKKDHDR